MFSYKQVFIIAGILLAAVRPVHGQQKAAVDGYTKDATTGETLISANIALENTTVGTSSNTSGYYTLTDLAPGTYTILCSYIGYSRFSKEITLKAGQTLRLDIELQPERAQLGSVVVQSNAEAEEEKHKIGMAEVSTKLIKDLPSVLQADVFRSIQLLPGVKSASDFSSGLYIRGGSPDQTLILLDGTTVYNPTHFFGFFSTFNPDAIKDVQLYKGGYPAKYGGRLGSVLAIYNKDGNRKKTDGSLTLGLLSSRAMAEGPYSKGSWMLAFRRSTLEPVLAILKKTIDNIPSSFYFWDANGKFNYDADDLNKLSLAFYAGQDYLDFPFAEDAAIKLRYGNNTLTTKWTHLFSNKVFSTLTLTGSHYFNYPQFNIADTPFRRSNTIYDLSLKGDLQYIPNQQHQFEAGFWSGTLTMRLKDHFNNEEIFHSRIYSRYSSLYLQDTWKPSLRWQIIYGARLNYFSRGNYLRISPRLSIEYRPTTTLRLQAAYGRYYQFLTLVTNQAFSGFDTWLTSAKGVGPAFGDQWILGVKSQPSADYDLSVEGYYRTMEDLFELDPFIPDDAGLDYAGLFRFGEGYAYGIETRLQKTRGRLNGYVGYTYSVTRRRFPDFNQDRFFPPRYDREHELTLVANYQLSRRWKATFVFTYSTGQAYTRPLGRTVITAPFTSGGLDLLTVGKVNASRLPAYHRMDIAFARSGTFLGLWPATLQLQVINMLSHRNIWFYNYDFNKNPIERKEVLMLPIIPSVSYTIKF